MTASNCGLPDGQIHAHSDRCARFAAVNALRDAADALDALQTPANDDPAFRDPALWLHVRADRIARAES